MSTRVEVENAHQARQAVGALNLLIEPCEQLIEGLKKSEAYPWDWPEGALRISNILEAIDSMQREWRGEEIPPNQTTFVYDK